jgi:hypothetical protein
MSAHELRQERTLQGQDKIDRPWVEVQQGDVIYMGGGCCRRAIHGHWQRATSSRTQPRVEGLFAGRQLEAALDLISPS